MRYLLTRNTENRDIKGFPVACCVQIKRVPYVKQCTWTRGVQLDLTLIKCKYREVGKQRNEENGYAKAGGHQEIQPQKVIQSGKELGDCW